MIRTICLLLMALCVPVLAAAHETTRSYLTLSREGTDVSLSLRVAFRDIEVAVWLDEDLDGAITWGETLARLPAVQAYVTAALALDAGGACNASAQTAGVTTLGGLEYLELGLRGTCPQAQAPLDVTTRLFAGIDPDHRVFVSAVSDGQAVSGILGKANPSIRVAGTSGGIWGAFLAYFRSGMAHLVGGADHLVFLFVLMLPAVCRPGSGRTAASGVLAAVTGFTVAHALTLTAATIELLRPRSDVIEFLIAVSIVMTALDNVRPYIPAPRFGVAAFFGLIHGFGFATALGGLQLSTGGVALALLGFNLGIEAAQIAVVMVAMPALFALQGGRFLLWFGSTGALAVGVLWCLTRAATWIG